MGKSKFNYIALLLIRIGIFNVIGNVIGLNERVSITIAAGVAIATILIEVLYSLRKKNKQNDLKDE
ncbi:hypothetical protein [Oceanobacillus rekensis]|uniref:hypothetical protein n=1 Tax=Oceanobacillus rekensis TaxID=937927 RepID=UPI000B44B72B|nr:hypothetical protein [Oceanobacillus rekensis]